MTLNSRTLIRSVAAGAVALAVFLAMMSALSASKQSAEMRQRAATAQQTVRETGRAIAAIDQGLSSAAMRFATGGDAATSFQRARTDFFRLARNTHALVYFQLAEDRASASAIAQPIATGVTEFRSGARTFYLAASQLALPDSSRPDAFPRVGEGARLPFELVAGAETQRALGTAISAGIPVASPIFIYSNGAMRVTPGAAANADGPQGFWRFRTIESRDPVTGQDRLSGVIGALVDAKALLNRFATPSSELLGPMDALTLPDSILGGELGVAAGNQGFVIRVPLSDPAGPGLLGLLAALIGAAAAAGAVILTTLMENRGRVEAEQALRRSKTKFRKRSVELKRSEDRFRRLAESTNVVPWAADLSQQRFTYIGPQIQKLTGYPVSSWCAPGFWVGHVHPEDRHHTFVDALKDLAEGEYATLEYRIRSADGHVIHIRNMLTMAPRKDGGRIAQGYMLDITEMKTAQQKLDEARRHAEEANKSKSEFLANMSHELRTPLNAVIGFAEVMKDEIFGPIGDRYRDYAESVYSSGKHLLDLINDVLDLSKIEAGKIELLEEETDLGALLSKCRTVLHERASSAGLHIRLEIPAPLPSAMVDSRRLRQIILNLMSNSIKFTAPGGRISLRGELIAPKGLRLTVADTGVGMTKAELEVALQQFGQIDNELSRNHNGTGLGLPITRSLIELHGGEMEVESRKEVGTSVHVWIPMQRVLSLKQKPGAKNSAQQKEAG